MALADREQEGQRGHSWCPEVRHGDQAEFQSCLAAAVQGSQIRTEHTDCKTQLLRLALKVGDKGLEKSKSKAGTQ